MIARAVPVPRDAQLSRYVAQEGCYTDCYEVMHPLQTDLPRFITAFYTTWLFRLERSVLAALLRHRITDAQVAALADGSTQFAAWEVEARDQGQILLRDISDQTRSWLAVAPKEGGVTRLLFGSALLARNGRLPPLARVSIPAHRVYAKALLRLAERKLRRG
ncbi:MAG: hypothetical protein AAF943_03575 [Pseudomonadota bacterium]